MKEDRNHTIRAWVTGFLALLVMLALVTGGCGGAKRTRLVFAATRDLEGFGVLQAWAEEFQRRSGRKVELVTAMDRELMEMAKHGECDLLLTHIPEEEERLERYGYVEGRREVMRDAYLLVGPKNDPAGVREAEKISDALARIAEAKQTFLVRVDGSGVAAEAEMLWGTAGVSDFLGWMKSEKGDMEETLRRASREGAYTLCDRSTYERLTGELELEVLFEGDELLANPYHVMTVSLLTYPDTNIQGAQEFVEYLLSDEARRHLELGAWGAPEETP